MIFIVEIADYLLFSTRFFCFSSSIFFVSPEKYILLSDAAPFLHHQTKTETV